MWVLKLLGAAMLTAAGGFAGNSLAFALVRREKALTSALLFINSLSAAIKVGAQPLPVLLADLLPDGFYYENGAVRFERRLNLNEDDRSIINGCITDIGMGDIAFAERKAAAYSAIIKNRLQLATREKEEKYRLFKLTGVSGGIILSLLLL